MEVAFLAVYEGCLSCLRLAGHDRSRESLGRRLGSLLFDFCACGIEGCKSQEKEWKRKGHGEEKRSLDAFVDIVGVCVVGGWLGLPATSATTLGRVATTCSSGTAFETPCDVGSFARF